MSRIITITLFTLFFQNAKYYFRHIKNCAKSLLRVSDGAARALYRVFLFVKLAHQKTTVIGYTVL